MLKPISSSLTFNKMDLLTYFIYSLTAHFPVLSTFKLLRTVQAKSSPLKLKARLMVEMACRSNHMSSSVFTITPAPEQYSVVQRSPITFL